MIRLPLTELFDDRGVVPAERGREFGDEDVRVFLRTEPGPFVLADVGEPLRWVYGDARFALWKDELRDRVVEPGVQAFRLEDYPGERCYVLTEWLRCDGTAVVVAELHH